MYVIAYSLGQKVESWNCALRISNNFAFAPQTQYDSAESIML